MILVDSSVWVDHLRGGDAGLADLLQSGDVLAHPFVVGELACGDLRARDEILGLLRDLPQAKPASDDEALAFIARHRLMARGIGYIDVHLLASAALSQARLWTRDKRLGAVAGELALSLPRP